MANDIKNMKKASRNKADEFYTMLTDIEKEMMYYEKEFKDKVVYCNCDDPVESNFFKYFQLNFYRLGIKKLICTHYEYEGQSYKLEIERDITKENQSSFIPNEIKTDLEGNGDFRNDECIELLKEADIVVTNPPFSLWREYLAQLIKYNKKFLIIGNQNAITYKEVFPLLKDNKIWLGVSMNGSNRYFRVPDDYPLTESTGKIENGVKYAFVKGVRWFTNLDYKQRHDKITLFRKYNPIDYPKYDNYDAIEVNKVTDIPMDYEGVMGVPITFLGSYNPEQFEILGITCNKSIENPIHNKFYKKAIQIDQSGKESSGNKVNDGPTILTKTKPKKGVYYKVEGIDGYLQIRYARILIRKK